MYLLTVLYGHKTLSFTLLTGVCYRTGCWVKHVAVQEASNKQLVKSACWAALWFDSSWNT